MELRRRLAASKLCWHLRSECEPWNHVYVFNRSLLQQQWLLLLWFPFRKAFILYIERRNLLTTSRKIDRRIEMKGLITICCMSMPDLKYALISGCYLTNYNDKIKTFVGSRYLKSAQTCDITEGIMVFILVLLQPFHYDKVSHSNKH